MTQTPHFRLIIDQYDKKIPFVVVTHGECADGAFASYVSSQGLINLGFRISLHIDYFHNTDNFSHCIDQLKNKYILFLDVTPLLDDYIKIKSIGAIISIIDHHPPNFKDGQIVRLFDQFEKDRCNYLLVTDRTHCATTLACSVFDQELLKNSLINHINLFDNCVFDDPVTVSIAAYNKSHLHDIQFCEKALKKPLNEIIKEGYEFQSQINKKVKSLITKGKKYSVDIKQLDKSVEIMEILIDDELLSNSIAEEFYKHNSNAQIIITIFHSKNGTKFSFRSVENPTGITASTLAQLIGGGGHPHCSAFFYANEYMNTFLQVLKNK